MMATTTLGLIFGAMVVVALPSSGEARYTSVDADVGFL
jgi:hypothetical protein